MSFAHLPGYVCIFWGDDPPDPPAVGCADKFVHPCSMSFAAVGARAARIERHKARTDINRPLT
jgi:hypothetical protein